MRYAITYAVAHATDDTWNSVDTIIVETNKEVLDMPSEEIADIFELSGLPRGVAHDLAKYRDYWFVRNVNDVDVDLTREGR